MEYFEIEKLVLDIIKNHSNIVDAIDEFIKKVGNTSLTSLAKEFNLDDDFQAITSSIDSVFSDVPPSKPLKALWFGIYETDINEYVAYISGNSKYSKSDEELSWAVNCDYLPENRNIQSTVLHNLHSIILSETISEEITHLALWYLSLVIGIHFKNCFKRYLFGKKIAIVVGFDEGDFLCIGTYDSFSLKTDHIVIKKPAVLKKTKTKDPFYTIQKIMPGAWMIDDITPPDKSLLVCGFANSSKKYDFPDGLIATLDKGWQGFPCDFTTDTYGNAVISERMMEITMKYSKEDDVQFIPVKVGQNQERYFVLNILRTVNCIDMINSSRSKYHEYLLEEMVINTNLLEGLHILIARSEDLSIKSKKMLISRELKESFELNKCTGFEVKTIEWI